VTDQLFFHRGKFTLTTVLRVKQHEPAEDFLSEQARLRQHAGSFRKGGYYACSAASPMRTPTRILSHLFGLPRPRAATCCVATHSHAHATHARTHARTLARTRNARALARSLARAHTHAHTHTHTRSIRAAVQLCADHAFRAAGGTFACIGRDSRARPACGLRVRACSDPKLGMQTRHTLDISRDLQVRACMCACVRCGVCAYAHDPGPHANAPMPSHRRQSTRRHCHLSRVRRVTCFWQSWPAYSLHVATCRSGDEADSENFRQSLRRHCPLPPYRC